MIRILIVDDHTVFAESIAHRLAEEEDIHIMGLAADEVIAEQILEKEVSNIDVVLLDIRLSQGEAEGLELAEHIRKNFPQIKVIMLSMHLHGAYIHRMFNSGIGGYLLKNTGIDEVLYAIRCVAAGKRYYSQEIMSTMDEFILSGAPVNPQKIHLTPTESYILEQLAEGLSSREISQKMGNKESTVEVHRRNILAKFGVNKVAKLVKEAIRLGFLSIEK
ncbi:MAG: response regulator transcription factor [Bacteroidota bacterium]